MAAVYDDARAAALLEGDTVVACQQIIALHGLLTEVLYKADGQALKWDGSNPKIPANQAMLDALYVMNQLRDLMDNGKGNITRGANLTVTPAPVQVTP